MTETTTDVVVIDRPAALRMIREAVAERGPDFVYSTMFGLEYDCLYAAATAADWELYEAEVERGTRSEDDEPTNQVCACIVGVGLNKLGMPLSDLLELSAALPDLAGFEVDPKDRSAIMARKRPFKASFYAEMPLHHDSQRSYELNGTGTGFRCTESATRILWAAQEAQDANATWGTAEQLAIEVAGLLTED